MALDSCAADRLRHAPKLGGHGPGWRYAKQEPSRLDCCLNCFTPWSMPLQGARAILSGPGVRGLSFKLGGRLHAKGISLVTDLVRAFQFSGRWRLRWCPGTGSIGFALV